MNGADVLVMVEDPDTADTFLPLALQRDATIAEEAESIDRSSKEQRARRVRPGRYQSTVELEGLVQLADPGQASLTDAIRAGSFVLLRTTNAGDGLEEADAVVTSLEKNHPDQDESTYSASFDVDGEWSEVTTTTA